MQAVPCHPGGSLQLPHGHMPNVLLLKALLQIQLLRNPSSESPQKGTNVSKQVRPPDPRLGRESVQPEPGELTVAPSWPLSIRDTGAPPPPSPTDFKGVS